MGGAGINACSMAKPITRNRLYYTTFELPKWTLESNWKWAFAITCDVTLCPVCWSPSSNPFAPFAVWVPPPPDRWPTPSSISGIVHVLGVGRQGQKLIHMILLLSKLIVITKSTPPRNTENFRPGTSFETSTASSKPVIGPLPSWAGVHVCREAFSTRTPFPTAASGRGEFSSAPSDQDKNSQLSTTRNDLKWLEILGKWTLPSMKMEIPTLIADRPPPDPACPFSPPHPQLQARPTRPPPP